MSQKNIIIFDTDINVEEISTKSELELFYQDLKKNKDISPNQIDLFYEMQLSQNLTDISTTIDAIVLEQILPYIIPIINHIPVINIKMTYVNSDKAVNKSAVKPDNKIIIKLKENKLCIFNKNFITASKGSDITVIGFIFNKKLSKVPSNLKSKFQNDYGDKINIDLLKAGSFSDFNFVKKMYCDFFTSAEVSIKPPYKLYNDLNEYLVLIFSNDIKNDLKFIQKAIQSFMYFFQTSNAQMYYYAEIYIKLHLSKERKPPLKNLLKNHPVNKFITQLEKIIKQNLSFRFTFESLLHINNIGYYNQYNKLIAAKPDNRLIDEISYKIKAEELKEEQIFQKFKKQMDLFQKKNIAFKKFGISELYKLSNSEIAIVEKDFNKLNTLSKVSKDELKAVYDLYSAIETEDKNAINASILKLNTLDTSKKYDLSKKMTDQKITTFLVNNKGQNLVCPHVIDKANLLISSYKDVLEKSTKIRNFLIENYSIVDFSDGYYCKICGELVGSTNSTNISLTSRQDYGISNDYDLLYSMIYREIIYILLTYVAFTNSSTLNIVNIVKNITDLIKDEIRTIESNLLKIRTIDKEAVATSLHIYIYIYVFAAVSQLIYTNINSMKFKQIFIKGGDFNDESPLLESYGGKLKPAKKSPKKLKPAKKSPKKLKPAKKSPEKLNPEKLEEPEKILEKRAQNTKKNRVQFFFLLRI